MPGFIFRGKVTLLTSMWKAGKNHPAVPASANHVHCVYRDFDTDFGDGILEHYEKQHRQP